MIFLSFFTFCMLILSISVQKFGFGKLLSAMFAFAWTFVICAFITYSADWEIYKWLHEMGVTRGLEPMFGFISSAFEHKNFPLMHMLYVGVYSTLMVILISFFNRNPFLIVLIYLPLTYLFYTTQIRYFMGYYAAMLSLYFFSARKNYLVAVIFMVFALLNHYAFFLTLAFIPLVKFVKKEKMLRMMLYASLLIALGVYIFVTIFPQNISTESKMSVYFQTSSLSGFLGGLFFFTPYLLLLGYVLYVFYKKIKHNPLLKDDREMIFLYHASVFPLLFIVTSFFAQVYGHRFIVPGSLFWVLLFFRMKTTAVEKLRFFALLIFVYFYIYVIPEYVMSETTLPIVKETFYSNTIFQKYFF